MADRRSGSSPSSLMLVALLSMWCATASAEDAVDLVPNWTLNGPGGELVNFYEHSEGKTAVLLFWATWCPYCRALMPHIEKVRQEFEQKNVNFYALNIWEDGDPAAHMSENGYGFQLLLSADEVAKQYGIKGTPGLLVVDPARRIQYVRRSGTGPRQVENDLRFVLGNIARE